MRKFVISVAKKGAEEEISRTVNTRTSAKVGAIGPWPNRKALRASD
jgi:hypothetical protein